MKPLRDRRRRQAGAALLLAMLTVTLVATFAAAALWQQYRSVEVEAAERMRVQSSWVLTGALDWARLILREDGRGSTAGVDHLAEPWAVPLQEARLSTFLAADRDNTSDDDTQNAFLSGQITDLQSRLNVGNLKSGSSISEPWLQVFSRLFELLGLPQSELNRMAENLRFASDADVENLSSSQAPLTPQETGQIVWLGVSPATVAALAPYVTALPNSRAVTTVPTSARAVNVNTASAEVIYAAIPGISMADAQRVVAERANSHFRNESDVARLLVGHETEVLGTGKLSVGSNYFEVIGRLRFGDVVVEERSVVQRVSGEVRTLSRQRVALGGAAATPAPAR